MPSQEHELIAFAPGELPGGPWLVFAPHADDETFGMGGSLLRAQAAGIATHVIVLTDGALGGDMDDLVSVRQAEVEQAAEMLGLASLAIWHEPDRGLSPSAALIDKVKAVISELAPASVFFPGAMELHPDHRMTAELVWAALQQCRTSAGNPVPKGFAYEISVQNPVNRFVDISTVIADKQAVMQLYVSQNSQNSYPELVVALNKGRTFTLPAEVTYAEGFYEFSAEELGMTLAQAYQQILRRYFQ